jgi:hypothetical protein
MRCAATSDSRILAFTAVQSKRLGGFVDGRSPALGQAITVRRTFPARATPMRANLLAIWSPIVYRIHG